MAGKQPAFGVGLARLGGSATPRAAQVKAALAVRGMLFGLVEPNDVGQGMTFSLPPASTKTAVRVRVSATKRVCSATRAVNSS